MSQEDKVVDTEEIRNSPCTNVKKGIKLPKSESQWRTANAFFQANLPLQAISNCLEEACKQFPTTILKKGMAEFKTTTKQVN